MLSPSGRDADRWRLVAPISILDALLRTGHGAEMEAIEVTFAVLLALAEGGLFAWYRTHRLRAAIAAALMLTIAMAGPVPIERTLPRCSRSTSTRC